MSNEVAGVLVAAAGAGMIWTARDSAEVGYDVAQYQRKLWGRFLPGGRPLDPKTGTLIGRALGAIVIVAGILLAFGVIG
jgi:hypothetical protein